MKLKFIATGLLILLTFFAQAQLQDEKSAPDELYLDANSYFFFEDYEEALALYQQVIKEIPKNSNLNYRIGICYLNIPGKRNRAIPYLESATASTTKNYRENSIKETKAPLDVYFFLGSAYLANNQMGKAKETFLKFKSLTEKSKQYDLTMLNLQLQTVESSTSIQKHPTNFLLSNLGPSVNDRFSNFSPAISYNGQVLAYTSKRKFYQAIYVTRKAGDSWSTPVNITPELETDQNLQALSLNYDGTELYLYKDDNRDGNIYVSHYRNGRWNPIENLGSNINTKYWEASACISPDGKTLYFSSNREGGFGELDLYKSTKQANGTWGPAINLGPTINTNFNETTPSLTSTGTTLFYASDGMLGLGGYDIYFSNAMGSQWSQPENLGYPLNTPDDDIEFRPIDDGQYGLLAKFDEDSYGEMDIFKVEVFSERYAREVVLHNQMAQRKRTAGEKVLVIDTVGTQKLALLLPDGINLDDYTDPNKKVKLYFGGKRYDLRDKVNLMTSKKTDITNETKELLTIAPQNASITTNADRIQAISTAANPSNTDISESQLFGEEGSIPFLLDSRYQTNLGQQIRSIIADIFKVPGMPQQPTVEQIVATSPTNSVTSEFYKIFKAIGLNIPDSVINNTVNAQIESPLYATAYLLSLQNAKATPSDELLNALVEYFDKLASSRDNYTRYSKAGAIKKEQSNSCFLALFNTIKSKADGKLKLMLNSIDPESNKITTFKQLIALLKSIDEVEFQSYKSELTTIMAEVAAEEFYQMNAQDRSELLAAFERPSILHYAKYAGGAILLIALLFIILFLAKKRKSNK